MCYNTLYRAVLQYTVLCNNVLYYTALYSSSPQCSVQVGRQCIHKERMCDGLEDCDNGADEKGCCKYGIAQPYECGRQRTLNIVHAQTAAQQQSNGSYEARMSGKCGEWRD